MGIQRYATTSGSVRYRARIKFHGREVATRVFERRRDAEAWEREQKRRLHLGEWFDPRRGRVPLEEVAEEWLASRSAVKRRTRETDESTWRLHLEPRFGDVPVSSITTAEVETWVGSLVAAGHSASSVNRYLATLRSVLNYAVRGSRITVNPAALVRPPSGAHTRREGKFLTIAQLWALRDACADPYADVVPVLGLAGLQVGDVVELPGAGLRLQRTVLASRATGQLFVDTLKNKRARTVPLVADLVPIVAGRPGWRQAAGRLAVRRPRRRAAQRGELEAVGPLDQGHRGDRRTGPARPRPPAHRRQPVAQCRCRPEGRAADPGARLRGDDDGPLRPPDRPEPLGRREEDRRGRGRVSTVSTTGEERGHDGGTDRKFGGGFDKLNHRW